MKMQKLYTCATAWHWDVVPEDDGAIVAYTAPEHVLDGEDCARECGVIELEVIRARIVVPGKSVRLATLAEDRERNLREFENLERRAVKLADDLLGVASDVSDVRVREAGLRRALAVVEDELRQGRRRARIKREAIDKQSRGE